ncbi:hypothetical protein K9E37_03035 [Gardnerella swidsinskii]|uniref:hypothetical protein n=1 Tax=Gardnerella swidsinskii TaxID=2792979 RepID=UPI00200E9A19|nr:hypothetical protein [Gardnerella swidsinskii]UQA89207.1 hypothetical protein K9E37_03035 [Gardnerella swidsinskii]
MLVLIIVPGLVLVFWCFFAIFDTPVFWLVFQWFWGVCFFGGFAFLAWVGVSLSLAAQRGWFSSVEVDGPAGVVVV